MYIAHCTLPSTILSKAFYGLVAAHSTRDTGHGSGQKAEFPIPCLDDWAVHDPECKKPVSPVCSSAECLH